MSIFGTAATGNGGARFANSLPASAVDTATGDLIVVGVGWSDGGTVTGVTDTAGNTYSPLTKRTGGSTGYLQFWYVIGATANASNVVTAATSLSNNYSTIFVWDVPVTATPTYDTDSDAGTASSGDSGAFTTTGTDELVLGFSLDGFGSDSYAAGSGYTFDGDYGTFSGAAHGVFSTTLSGAATIFSSVPSTSYVIAVAFKGAGGPPPPASAQPVVCIMQ
jgi:hypothetical protein